MTEEKKTWRKLIILPLAAIGAYVYRMRGGLPSAPNLPRPLDQLLFICFPSIIIPAVPMWKVIGLLNAEGASINWTVYAMWIVGYLASVTWALVWELKGHGGTMDFGHNPKEPDNGRTLETYEYLIYPWLYNMLPRAWYDFVGHSISGLLSTLMSGAFVCATGNILAGVCLALSGLTKGTGYAIGWAIFKNTESGEWISGGLRWFCAGMIFAFLM